MSSIHVNTLNTQFRFAVPVENLMEFDTPEIKVGGVPWKIRIRKVEEGATIKAILMCEYKNTNPKWWIDSSANLKLLSTDDNDIEKNFPTKRFCSRHLQTELENIIQWDNLIHERNHFIERGHFVFDASISSTPLRKETEESGFELKNTKFGMVLRDLNNLDFVDSDKMVIRGTKWFVKFRRNDKSLGVYLLNEDCENFAWSYEVDFKVTLFAIGENVQSLEKSIKRRFDNDRKKFGWFDFIMWDELFDKTKGYVNSNDANFQISIEVESSQPLWKCFEKSQIGQKSKCPICLEVFGEQEVLSADCGHIFCGLCIKNAITNNARCALCNKEVVEDELRVVYLYS